MNELVKVKFHGDELEALKDAQGKVWVSLKRCCENLQVDDYTQSRKLKNKAWAVTSEMTATGLDGKSYVMTMIDLESLPGWLFTIDARKVKEAVREKLIRYQREAAKVLAEYFFGIQQTPTPPANNLLAQLAILNQQCAMSLQILQEQQESLVRVERQTAIVNAGVQDHEERIEQIEQKQAEAAANLLPPASGMQAPAKTTRALIRERINFYAQATGVSYADCWRTLYREYFYRCNSNLTLRAKNAKIDRLELAEREGEIDTLYSVACDVFRIQSPVSAVA